MPTALRAFLMLRSAAGVWSVTVHRDLEDLVSAWMGRPEPTTTCGVLHLGFNRPPSQEFDAVASGREGRLLVTASARHGLTAAFGTTEGEVGRVGTLGVHLGTRGWGYVVEDNELPALTTAPMPVVVGKLSGWVAQFVRDHPETADALRHCAIFDDADYLEREDTLEKDLRKQAGIYRLDRMIAGDRSDPCAVARAAPPWLAYRTFDSINTSVRVTNVFKNLKIHTVADLAVHSIAGLMQTQNFGRKSATDLQAALETALEEGPQPEDRFEHEASTSTLLESIKRSLFKYEDRSRDIMLRRMGLGQTPETLQELGERYGVSRERIRQVEAKVTRRLIREEIWDDLLNHKLTRLLANRRMPLPLKGIDAADPWFAGLGGEAYALRYLLNSVSEGPAKVIRIDEIDYVGMLDQETWEGSLGEARRYLASGAESGWTEAQCRSGVDAILPESCSEFRELLWEHASRRGHFVDGTLVSYGRGAETIVQAVLAASDRPLHFAEIANLATERAGREIDVRRAHSAAASIGLLMGRGIYGLDHHVPIPPEEMAVIAEQAADIVFEGEPGRQWHANEIVAELIERGIENEALDKYLLDIALRQAGVLERLGRLVWHDVRSPSADANRIDIRQAVIAALHEAGEPLSADQIRARVRQIRGVNGAFQIHPTDPVIRIGSSMWGLNDRDIPIKRPDQPKILGALVDILAKRGSGIHESELADSAVLASMGLTVPAFFSLAVTDSRLRTSTGRFLYLGEWGNPRRETIAEAVRAIMTSTNAPMKFGDISNAVRERVRRDFQASAISGCLQALDARHDAAEGTWSLPAIPQNDIDEDPVPADDFP
jgi:hypothetical protein